MIALAPTLSDFPGSSAAAAGFQKIVEASGHGVPVAANPRETEQVPTSLRPKPWARADEGRNVTAASTQTASRANDGEVLIRCTD